MPLPSPEIEFFCTCMYIIYSPGQDMLSFRGRLNRKQPDFTSKYAAPTHLTRRAPLAAPRCRSAFLPLPCRTCSASTTMRPLISLLSKALSYFPRMRTNPHPPACARPAHPPPGLSRARILFLFLGQGG
eukprot:Tamp_18534.p2 GENE.Tamp_18534~~Tamp_18534.p2  ORF type:complete len:129 (-),score=9.25 Tamp_18534:388-774(-)